LLLFAFALALRVAGLTWGLPTATRWYSLHPDERQVASAAFSLDFFAGDFNPDFYNYPSLFIYLTYFVHGALALFGFFAPLSNATAQWQLLHDFILSGRVVSAILGAATAPVVFFLARAALTNRPRAALFAGVATALAPGFVQHSHFATVDCAATFFIALSLLFATRALNFTGREATRALLFSAACAGLAAATKYNAGLVVVAPLCAAWQLRRALDFDRTLWFKIPIIAAIFFFLGCPGALLYSRDFWGDGQNTGFAYELFKHPREGSGEIFQATGNGWIYHLGFNLPFTFTAPALLLALVGIGLAVRAKETRSAPSLVFAALFLVSLGFSQVRFMRYVFPLVPVLCVGLAALALLPRTAARAASIATVGLLVVAASNALAPFVQTDPRDKLVQQVLSTSPSIGLLETPWFWTPPFSPQDAPPGTPPQLSQQALAANPKTRLVLVPDAATLSKEKPLAVAISEFEWRDKERLANPQYLQWKQTLESSYEKSLEVEANIPFLLPGRAFVPHDFLYTHPRVRLYQQR
jgi:4-amino-4-deoxy-L-arabinose transferase-like glycosyltransferase